jgi:N-acetyl-anhydromuramoyl-L-alanine amidase
MPLQINLKTNLLNIAKFIPSPFCDSRPQDCNIDLIVIHNISLPPGSFEQNYIDDLFLGKLDPQTHPYFAKIYQQKVSAHLLIRRNGEVTQYVPFNKRAWHAGNSNFHGRSNCNDFSIGIELEGTDEIEYTTAQYQQLVAVIKVLLLTYPHISLDRIVGHNEIAPDRKTDPGKAFNWTYFKEILGSTT